MTSPLSPPTPGQGPPAGRTTAPEPADPAPPPPVRTSAHIWWVCGLLFLATVLNYLDRQVLALTAESIMDEFGLTKEAFGGVIASFRYAYGIFQIGGGWLVDAYGARLVYPGALGLWSLMGALTALATTSGALVGFRFLVGVGEAFNWPAALQVTQRLVPPADRALANGLFNSGAAAGAIIAPIVVTTLSLWYGWRAAFVVTGALGGIWIVMWFRATRDWTRDLSGQPSTVGNALGVMGRLVRRRQFWLLMTSAVIVNGISYVLADWMPLYLKTERGFSAAIGNLLTVLIYASLETGNLLVGFFVRAMAARGVTLLTAKRRALVVSCLLMSCATAAGVVHHDGVAVVLLMLTALGVAGFLVIYLTLVQEVNPDHVGTTVGLLGGAANLVYGAVTPWIGRLADANQTMVTFGVVGCVPWIALLAIWRGMEPEAR